MSESRFERWSRLKAKARVEEQVEQQEVEGDDSASEEADELAVNETLSDDEILAKYELPNPDVSELGMDVKGFMRKEIPEALRRRALRSLWRSNPVLAVLDGLNDYDEDFNTVKTGADGVKTLYQVGKGMFDKVKRAEEKLQELAQQSENEIQNFEVDVSIPVKPQIENEASEAQATPVSDAQSSKGVYEFANKEYVEEAVEMEQPEAPVARYRPRMSFS